MRVIKDCVCVYKHACANISLRNKLHFNRPRLPKKNSNESFVRKGELPTPQDTGLKAHTISEANKRVNGILTKDQPTNEAGTLKKRRYSTTFTGEDRAKIGKYAAENGNASAVKHFKQAHPGLGESTVRYFKKSLL